MFIQLLQLLHQFLKSCDKLVNCLVFARADIACNAGSDMIREKFFIEGVNSGINSGRLDKDVVAVSIVFQHSYDSPYLSLNTFQTVDKFPAVSF